MFRLLTRVATIGQDHFERQFSMDLFVIFIDDSARNKNRTCYSQQDSRGIVLHLDCVTYDSRRLRGELCLASPII